MNKRATNVTEMNNNKVQSSYQMKMGIRGNNSNNNKADDDDEIAQFSKKKAGGLYSFSIQSFSQSVKNFNLSGFIRNSPRDFQNFIIVFIYYFFGYVFYSLVEGWDLVTCVYFCTVTLCTVGLGDVYPTSDWSRLFSIIYIFFGLAIVLRIVNDFSQSIIEYGSRKIIDRVKVVLIRNNININININNNNNINNSSSMFEKVFSPIVSILIIIIVGTLFYVHNEGYSVIQGMYLSVVISTTGKEDRKQGNIIFS